MQIRLWEICGNIELSRRAPERAFALYSAALRAAEALPEPLLAAKLQGSIAIYHKLCGRLEASLAAQERALAGLQAAQAEPLGIAITLGRLGSLHTLLGHGDIARSYFQQALAMLEGLPDGAGFYAGALLDYAELLDDEEEQLAAMAAAEQAARGVADWHSTSLALACQTLTLQAIGRPVEAQQRGREAIQVAQQSGARVNQGIARYGLAAACWRLRQRAEAEALLAEALQIAEQLGYLQMVAEIHRVHAELLVDSGEAEAAVALLEISVAQYREVGVPVQLAEALLIQGRALLATGRDPTPALDEAHTLATAHGVRPGARLGRGLAAHGRPLQPPQQTTPNTQ